MEPKKLTIGHLFPDLLNLYGDRGNMITLQNRLRWRGLEAEVKTFEKDDAIDFSELDIVFLGGGSDREQLLVCERLKALRSEVAAFVESNGVLMAVCGGYQLLGHYYKLKNETIEGLSILDIYTESGEGRLIGNVVIESDMTGEKELFVGFENHGGRTHIGSHTPFGKVLYGHGNNGEDTTCGVVYKNVLGTYLHGPLLPKNPKLADYLLACALRRKYGEPIELPPLDDTAEQAAHDYIVKRFLQA